MILLSGGGAHLQAGLPERRPARQGRRRPGRWPPHRLGARDRADRRQPGARSRSTVEEPYAPLHVGTTRDDPRDLAVGRRQPLHRAHARAEQRARARRRRARSAPTRRRRPVDLDQLFNTLDPQDRARRCRGHPGLGDAVPGRRATSPTRPRSTSTRRSPRRARWCARSRATSRRSSDLIVYGAKVDDRAGRQRRDDLTDLVAQHQPDGGGDRRRERRALRGARPAARRRCARATRRSSTCARRSTTSTGCRPRRKPATKDLAQVLPRAAPARRATRGRRSTTCARWSPRRAPNNDLIDLLNKAPKLAEPRQPDVRALDHGAAQGRAGRQLHPPLHAGPRGLAPRLRPGRRRTTTPTATTPASSRSSTPSQFTDNPAGGVAARRSRRRSASTGLQSGNLERCPGAASQPPRRRLGAVARHRRHPRLRSDARCCPGHEARRSPSSVAARVCAGVARRARPPAPSNDGGGALQGARDLPERLLAGAGRGRQDRRREGRQDRVARRHRRPEAAVVLRDRPSRASTTSARTRSARSGRSR